MRRTPRTTFPSILCGCAAILLLAAPGHAQPSLPGGGGDMISFEVESVDRETWIVTARDVETGERFSFRLPPEAFRGQRFRAELSKAGVGGKLSVQLPPEARLPRAVVDQPMGGQGGGVRPSGPRFDRDQAPVGPGRRPLPGRPGGDAPSDHPAYRVAGPTDFEVVSVDPKTWVVEARGDDGSTVSLEVDPAAFVGYRFQAAVADLGAGQGFELLARNQTPLADCCLLRKRPGR